MRTVLTILPTAGKFVLEELVANLRDVSDAVQKAEIIGTYLNEVRLKCAAEGVTFNFFKGITTEGGIVFWGPSAGQTASETNPIRNVIVLSREGVVQQMTLNALAFENPAARPLPIVRVNPAAGDAILLSD